MKENKPAFILAIILAAGAVLLYLPGVSGAFYYDDYANLSGLAEISGWTSFWDFVRSGQAGPLGRPISLFTFALQHSSWPNDGESLLLINIVIHACNAVLVFIVARLLHRLAGGSSERELEFAFIAASFWMCSPILASSSLILIQRMTTLAAFFVLTTVLAYLKAFECFNDEPKKRLLFQALVLGVGTLLAASSKENGVLLPSLVFTIEAALLRNNTSAAKYRNVRVAVLGLSVVVFLVYLSPLSRSWVEIDGFRGFSSWERIKGEFSIIWKYIYLIFLPRVAHFGPFQDQHLLIGDTLRVSVAGMSLLALLLVSFLARKKNPWPLFAVAWYLVGHLLESTALLLEPYYEHRNYVPLVGLSMLLAQLSILVVQRVGGVMRFAVYGYIAITASILFWTTSLWGKPLEAAKFWVETNPGSVRAVVHQVNLELASNQAQVAANNEVTLQLNKIVSAMQLLDRTIKWCEECLHVRLQTLAYSCIVESERETLTRLKVINDVLAQRASRVNEAAIDGTSMLAKLISEKKCNSLKYSDLDSILDKMLLQAKYTIYRKQRARIFYQKATLAYAESDYSNVEEYINEAEQLWPDAEPVIDYIVAYNLEHGKSEVAVELIERKLRQHASGEIRFSVAYIASLEARLKEVKHENQRSNSSKE